MHQMNCIVEFRRDADFLRTNEFLLDEISSCDELSTETIGKWLDSPMAIVADFNKLALNLKLSLLEIY